VRISNDGENWDQTGTLTTTGFTAIAYGKNRFVAIKSGTSVTNHATSTTVTGTWTAGALPSSSNWNSIAYGNNRFVAVSNTSGTIACTCSAITDVYKAGTDTDISSFSITTRGVANILFITATRAVVTGNLA